MPDKVNLNLNHIVIYNYKRCLERHIYTLKLVNKLTNEHTNGQTEKRKLYTCGQL